MKFIHACRRDQPPCGGASLDQMISPYNEVRLIDAFVDSLPLDKLGFRTDFPENGRPAYHPTILLKLLVYGYLNRIRSSRCLEKECHRNIELMWLLGQLTPDHNTIANFRKHNSRAITRVFRATVRMAQRFKLIGGELLAGDSTKLRAQNSKKNNYNRGKIARHLAYIEDRLSDCQQALSQTSLVTQAEHHLDAMARHAGRREYYLKLLHYLERSGEDQVSTSDPESRQLIIRNTITEVAYNVQATVDAAHCLLIDYRVTNHNDRQAMGGMLRRAKSIVRNNTFTALFDKGYYAGSELETAQGLGITALVAVPAPASNAPDPAYNVEHFSYDPAKDTYTCPEGHTLSTNGHVYTKHLSRVHPTSFHQYRTKACKTCQVRDRCTTAKNGKLIERNVYSPLFEENRQHILNNPELYRRRQAIVEHPFGTIKRQWGYSYVLSKKGMGSASADVGLMLVAYNLRRIFRIIGWERLLAYLRACKAIFVILGTYWTCRRHLSQVIKRMRHSVLYLQIAIFNQQTTRGLLDKLTLGVIKIMKKLLPLLSICLMFGCANTKELNEQIYEVQKQELENSPYESAQYAKAKIERQKRFRQKELPDTFKNRILVQSKADTVIVIEEFDEICSNCPASKMMVLHQDTIYSINREIEKGSKAKGTIHREPYKTVSLDNEYLSNYHQFLVIKKKLKNGADWKANPTSHGSDTCLGGDYTLATVIYPNGEAESMFVRCWWLGSSIEYLKE